MFVKGFCSGTKKVQNHFGGRTQDLLHVKIVITTSPMNPRHTSLRLKKILTTTYGLMVEHHCTQEILRGESLLKNILCYNSRLCSVKHCLLINCSPYRNPRKTHCPNLSLLHNKLTKSLAHKFQELGVQLDVELSQIPALSYRREDGSHKLHKMLEQGVNGGKWSDRTEPLRCVCRALERNCVRELREKWRDCYCELIHTDVRCCIISFSPVD